MLQSIKGHVAINVGRVAINVGHVAINVGHVAINVGHVAINVRHVAINEGHVAINVGHVAINVEHVAISAEAVTIPGATGGHGPKSGTILLLSYLCLFYSTTPLRISKTAPINSKQNKFQKLFIAKTPGLR